MRDRQLPGIFLGVEVRAFEELPLRVVQRPAIDHRLRAVGADNRLAAQRGELHRRHRFELKLQGQRADGRLEGGEVLELRNARSLHDGAVLEVRAVEDLVAGVGALARPGRLDARDGLQLEVGQRPVGQIGLPALRKDPAGWIDRELGQVLREETVDVREARAGRDVVERNDGVEVLEDLLEARAAEELVRRVVGGLALLGDALRHLVGQLGEIRLHVVARGHRVQREHRVVHATWVGHGPGDVPDVRLDRVGHAALVGTDGVIAPGVVGLVDRRQLDVAVAPAAAGALQVALQEVTVAVNRDAVDDLRHVVALRCGGEIDAPAAVAGRRRRMAERDPAEEGRESVPALDDGGVVGAGVGAVQHAIERVLREVGQQPVELHPAALAHGGVLRPRGEVQHRDGVFADVVGRVELPLPHRRREVHPMDQVVARLGEILRRALPGIPAVRRLVGIQLGNQVERGVIHRPVVLGVAADLHALAPGVADGLLRLG